MLWCSPCAVLVAAAAAFSNQCRPLQRRGFCCFSCTWHPTPQRQENLPRQTDPRTRILRFVSHPERNPAAVRWLGAFPVYLHCDFVFACFPFSTYIGKSFTRESDQKLGPRSSGVDPSRTSSGGVTLLHRCPVRGTTIQRNHGHGRASPLPRAIPSRPWNGTCTTVCDRPSQLFCSLCGSAVSLPGSCCA